MTVTHRQWTVLGMRALEQTNDLQLPWAVRAACFHLIRAANTAAILPGEDGCVTLLVSDDECDLAQSLLARDR